eukprot:TRINITY_DN2374_c0_g3_i1.p1 TRINITY_DN2374_c0_g3~~TRINITY_DN2374_c0_g3_i1.p1  ORF type:complete len:2326 (-),score=592.20 TRINITY_DN2374_c0_g3_i1:118-7041(-)
MAASPFGLKNQTQDPLWWLPHEEDVWVPARKLKAEGEKVIFQTLGSGRKGDKGETITIAANQESSLQKVYPEQLEGQEDICALPHVGEGALLQTVRTRYEKHDIYTRVARTLIAVNPFQVLGIYDSEYLNKYCLASNSLDLPPHIYSIASDAVRGIKDHRCDQAVLISGESGAGKTESAKLVLSFVTTTVNANSEDDIRIAEKVMQTNPILEAFGNAMTVRNNNSSRFGKWLDLRFCKHSMNYLGCTLTSYLLETTRVCSHAERERSYHVFYQLLGARQNPAFAELDLGPPDFYKFLRGDLHKAPGIDDAANFKEMTESLEKLNFTENTRKEIFSILAGVLELGNVDFDVVGGEASKVKQDPKYPKALERAAERLGIDAARFSELMVERKMQAGKDFAIAKNRPDQARGVRDALARLIYGRLFHWLIQRMNVSLMESDSGSVTSRLLGVLDIAGFECFERNSLEQLMINLSNEHLQQNFNRCVFKAEQEECAKEGIDMPVIDGFFDNEDVIKLIDSQKGSVLDLLDDVTLANMTNSTEETFVANVVSSHQDNSRMIVSKFGGGRRKTLNIEPGFGIKHYAGEVSYVCEGWLEKNMEKLPLDTAAVFGASSLNVVRELGLASNDNSSGLQVRRNSLTGHGAIRRAAGGGAKRKTVTNGFRVSLKDLMAKVGAAEPHYVRCVKPNPGKRPWVFDAASSMEQLLFSGVLAAVMIRQKGYAHRIPHAEFVYLYSCIVERLEDKDGNTLAALRNETDEKVKVEKLVHALPAFLPALGKESLALGYTKVFTKFLAIKVLDDGRQAALKCICTRIQSVMRGHWARRAVRRLEALRDDLRELLRQLEIDDKAVPRGRNASTATNDASPRGRRRRATSDLGGVGSDTSLITRLGDSEQAAQDILFSLDNVLAQVKEEGAVALASCNAGRAACFGASSPTASRRLKRAGFALDAKAEFRNVTVTEAQWAQRRLRRELAVAADLAKLSTSVDPIAIEQCLSRAKRLRLPDLGKTAALEERLVTLRKQLNVVAILEAAIADADAKPGAEMERAKAQVVTLQRAADAAYAEGFDENRSSWLPEVPGDKRLGDVNSRLQKALSLVDAERAAALAAERQKDAEQRAREAKEEQERQKAEEKKNAENQIATLLAKERASAAEAFEEKLAAERKSVEEEFSRRLAVEQENTEKQREAAMEAISKAESELADKMAAERAAAEMEFSRKLKEVTDKLTADRAELERESARRIEEQQAQLLELTAKLVSEREAVEVASAQQIAEEQRKAKELAEKLAAERDAAEARAVEVRSKQQDLETAIAERKALEADTAAKLAQLRNAFMEQAAAEQAAAREEFEARLRKERAAAEHELTQKLNAEHGDAERALARKLLDEHCNAEAALAKKLNEERARAEEELNQKLAEERSRAEHALQQVDERRAAEVELQRKHEEQRLAAENELRERFEKESKAAQDELKARLEQERNAAVEELVQQIRAEKMEVEKAAEEKALLEARLTEEREEAERQLTKELREEQTEAERKLAKQLEDKHLEATNEMERKLAEERAAAEEKLNERLAEERRRADDAEQEVDKRRAAEEALRLAHEQQRREAEEELKSRLQEENAAAQEELRQRLESERAAALKDLEQKARSDQMAVEEAAEQRRILEVKLKEEQLDEERQLAERLREEHREAERSLSKKLADEHLQAEADLRRTFNEQHALVEQHFTSKLSEERARAKDWERRASAERASKEDMKLQLEEERRLAEEKLRSTFETEKAASEEELKSNFEKERAAAMAELEERLNAERAAAEEALQEDIAQRMADLEAELEAQHGAVAAAAIAKLAEAEREFEDRLAEEKAAAERAFSESLGSAVSEQEANARRARKKRSIPGLLVSERSQILVSLQRAANEYDAPALQRLLGFATEDKLDDYKEVLAAKARFEELQDEDWLQLQLAELEIQVDERPKPQSLAILRLLNLARHVRGGDFGPGDEEARSAEGHIQEALTNLAIHEGHASIFDLTEEKGFKDFMGPARRAFAELKWFAKIKLVTEWEGYETVAGSFPNSRRGSLQSSDGRRKSSLSLPMPGRRKSSLSPPMPGRRKSSVASVSERSRNTSVVSFSPGCGGDNDPDEIVETLYRRMLSYSRKACIAGSLTLAPDDMEEEDFNNGAKLNFYNLMVCMGEKAAHEVQRRASRMAIMDLAAGGVYRDEIFVQVMKQLRNNPNESSLQLGWELLRDLRAEYPPSPPLIEFLRVFAARSAPSLEAMLMPEGWAADIISTCRLGPVTLWNQATSTAVQVVSALEWCLLPPSLIYALRVLGGGDGKSSS